jgi:hypothetical protein
MKRAGDLRITTILLVPGDMDQLRKLGAPQGLCASAMVRLAIKDYIRREARRSAKKA